MLFTATFYVMGIDLNTLKTSHDSLISIAVIVKTYLTAVVKVFERVSHVIFHMQACQPITAVAGSHSRHAPSNRVFKSETKIRLGKMPFISKL
jgi:hypothetical protein